MIFVVRPNRGRIGNIIYTYATISRETYKIEIRFIDFVKIIIVVLPDNINAKSTDKINIY